MRAGADLGDGLVANDLESCFRRWEPAGHELVESTRPKVGSDATAMRRQRTIATITPSVPAVPSTATTSMMMTNTDIE